MGMFDNLRCEPALPKVWPKSQFQTKSLFCTMTSYTITADGALMRKAGNWGHGTVPEMRIPYSGDVEFHDFDRDHGYIEFVARFDKGVLLKIWMEEWRAPHSKPAAKPPADAPSPTPEP